LNRELEGKEKRSPRQRWRIERSWWRRCATGVLAAGKAANVVLRRRGVGTVREGG